MARLSFPSLRAPHRDRHDLNQSGSIMLFVMAMVLMLTIAVVAILSMSLNSDVVALKLEDSTKRDHQIDGVLEDVVNDVRNDAARCTPAIPEGAYQVDCTTTILNPDPLVRRADLTVVRANDSTVVGKARIKVVDDPSPGYKIEVCDWLLSSDVTESLKGCA